jgi:2-aminoethylphosphonate aminotransferase
MTEQQRISKVLNRPILLNPGPATTSARVKSALVVADICPREEEFGELLKLVRQKVLRVVNAEKSHEAVLIPGPGTYAIETVLNGLGALEEEILILENGAYGLRMQQICQANNISHEVYKLSWDQPFSAALLESYLAQASKRFTTVCLIHHETTSGLLNPLEDIHAVCRKHNLKLFVDGMSSYAGVAIDLSSTPVDYLVSSSNKCIQGMAGYGLVIIKDSEVESILQGPSRGFSLDLKANLLSQTKRNEFLFTAPVQVLYALNEALDEFFEEGGHQRFDRYRTLATQMIKGMRELGFKTLVDDRHHSYILTTFLEPSSPQFNFEAYHDALLREGITIYPGKIPALKCFRISNIGDLNHRDIELFLEKTAQYLREFNVEELYN